MFLMKRFRTNYSVVLVPDYICCFYNKQKYLIFTNGVHFMS